MTLQNASRLHFLHLQNPNDSHRLHRNKVRLSRRSFPVSRHPHLLRFQRIPNSKVIRGMNWDNLELGNEIEDSDLSSVELSYTRTLSPALTLEHGFNKIEEEVEKLNLNPPTSKSGIVRIQVAVPPSAKALSWFCNQPQSQELLPQFYLCKNTLDSLPLNSHLFDGVPGVSGIGASVCFMGSSHLSKEWSSMKRTYLINKSENTFEEAHEAKWAATHLAMGPYPDAVLIYLSVDSPLIRAYGFIGINFDMESSFIKHGSGSFYFVIPQIELDEYEGISLLAATLAWDGHSTFDKAIHSFKLSLSQASKENYQDKCITSDLGKSTLMEEKNVQMVCINANSIEQNETRDDHLQPKAALTSSKFCFRLSSTLAVTHNVLDRPRELGCLLRGSANINSVWASLIVEECARLGLTYFCIAPGSRSSPLAVAASAHPRTTCIACFDERSLAFHAVGYARGSYRPAVVITSSGTAVSNLFPAVVEASQDFVPLLLLTADRPPELHDAGANQAINQVHHFGTYARFFFNLPTPTDRVPARMVLTTIDSAVFRATTAPNGPVHINCPFREPLEDAPREWMLSCLKGLNFWISRDEPFTKYIRIQHSHACSSQRQVGDVLNMIQCANKGLLLIGSIHTEDEMWAALHLSKHLSWPTVTDILSGLRFKNVLTEFPQFTEKVLFVDHLDHALLSESVRDWAQPDVIIQIGSRITSKRVSQMLEVSSPRSYIMVDKHPCRHDPSHIVTHRIQSTIVEFADSLLKLQLPRRICKWSGFMHAVNMMVAREIEFQIHSEYSLTEPHIAQVVSDALPSDAALFFGNSMVIRDADMYGCGWMNRATECTSLMYSWELSCIGIRVSGNRGASGIDGLLSTAIGYAIGSYKRVFCVIGDVSFLHDTNGLAIINQRAWRKPLTILVVNNHGGAIFSLLPIAEKTDPSILNRYFYTSHNTAIGKLCEAHSVNHLLVRTKLDLQRALSTAQQVEADFVIEVESCIEDNATFHSILQRSARQAADDTFNLLSRLSVPECTSSDFLSCEIHKMEYSLYRIQLSAPPTSARISGYPSWFYKEGFILAVYLEDGSVGFGEVAPIEIHKENLQDVEEQLRFFIHVIQGVKVSCLLPLLRGSFSSWIWECLGVLPHSIFPSVRCGLEMAILNALSARQGCSLANLLCSECSPSKTHLNQGEQILKKSSSLQICALLDSKGNPMEVAEIADKLVKEGFTTIKIKVGRRANPSEDATVIQEIRKKVGYQVKLRADANRSWTYAQAINFGTAVQNCDLQYIEEPVNLEDEIIKFHEETGLPIALDETIDSIQGDPLGRLAKFVHPGIVAVVIKPSVVGGFENATLIAKWAQKHDKLAVVSSAFESSLSLYAYIQFSYYLEQQNAHRCKVIKKEPGEPVAHGLGTYRWLKEDVTTESLRTCNYPRSEVVEASVEDTAQLLLNFKIDPKVIQRSYTGEHSRRYQMVVDYEDFSSSLDVLEVGKVQDNTVLVFLHGFLGTCEEWIPITKALSTSVGCISINLPGHGKSHIQKRPDKESKQESSIPIDVIANILCKLIGKITHSRVVVVGYSMGARIALYMALRCANQVNGAVIISGSPGLKNPTLRRRRILDDDARAKSLRVYGLESFLDAWYSKELWRSLRGHPHFKQIVSSRMQHADVGALANALSALSIGRQPCLWEDLKQTQKPLLFLYGEKDKKFKEINQQMFYEVDNASKNRDDKGKHIHEIKEIPNCGHAVHLENPLLVINAISSFLRKHDENISLASMKTHLFSS